MMKFKILLVGLALFSAFACEKRKNNNTAEQLDGGWEISRIVKADGELAESAMPQSVSLSACKVSDNPCDGLWTSNNGDQEAFEWTVKEKGTIFTIIRLEPVGQANQATSDLADFQGDYDILELDDVQFIVQKGDTKLEFTK